MSCHGRIEPSLDTLLYVSNENLFEGRLSRGIRIIPGNSMGCEIRRGTVQIMRGKWYEIMDLNVHNDGL